MIVNDEFILLTINCAPRMTDLRTSIPTSDSVTAFVILAPISPALAALGTVSKDTTGNAAATEICKNFRRDFGLAWRHGHVDPSNR